MNRSIRYAHANGLDVPGPRRELASYRRHMHRSYYPGMRRKYTWSCLKGWAHRLCRQAGNLLRERQRICFVFCVADTAAAFYCHVPYEAWDLEKYMPEWAKDSEG